MIDRRLPLGIDLGEARVRVAGLRRRGAALELLGVGTAEVQGDVRESLSVALKQLDVREAHAVAMIRSCDARLRVIRLPALSRRDLQRAARFEGVASFGTEEPVAVRSLVLSERGDQRKMVIAAARMRTVQTTLQILKASGLKPVRIDHEGCALARNTDGAILDIGLNRSSLVAVNDGIPVVRTMALGGFFFTKALAEALGTTYQLAEIRKITIGLAGAAADAVREFCSRVAVEISDLRERDGVVVDRLSLCGNGARLDCIIPALRDALGVPVLPVGLSRLTAVDLPEQVLDPGVCDWYGAISAAMPLSPETAMVA